MLPTSALPPVDGASPVRRAATQQDADAATEFTAAFLAEMLKHSGLEKALASDSGFGGETMASFFVDQVTRKIAERGGLGLTELITEKLEQPE